MAKKSKVKRMKKYDTERFLKFDLTCAEADNTNDHWDAHYIDLAWCMSALNRKLFRQGKVYHINNIYVHDTDGSAQVRFLTAPNTWVTRRAWNIGFKNWKKQRSNSLEGMGGPSPTGKWSDFKVFLDGNHISNTDSQHTFGASGENNPDDKQQDSYNPNSGSFDTLLPIGGDGNSADELQMGEWRYSKFYEPEFVDGQGVDEQLIHLMGPHYIKNASGELIVNPNSTGKSADIGSVSLITAMEEIWNNKTYTPGLPTDFEDAVYNRMFMSEIGDPNLLDDLEDENDMPPYHFSYLPGGRESLVGPIQKRACHIASQFSPTATVGGFAVPCGLLRIETQTSEDNTVGIVIEMAPGPYKGLLAEDM